MELPIPTDRLKHLRLIRKTCPAFIPTGRFVRTGKAALVPGSIGQRPVIAKVLTKRVLYWEQRFVNEINFYEHVQHSRLPVRTPALIGASNREYVLVLERLRARPLQANRYLTRSLSGSALEKVIDSLTALHRCPHQPQSSVSEVVHEAEVRAQRYLERAYLCTSDLEYVRRVLRASTAAVEFSHGDPVFSNILVDFRDRSIAFIDWEFAAYYPKGYDFAILWVMLQLSPALRSIVVETVSRGSSFDMELFLANLMLVLARELKIHDELNEGVASRSRSAALVQDLQRVRSVIQSGDCALFHC